MLQLLNYLHKPTGYDLHTYRVLPLDTSTSIVLITVVRKLIRQMRVGESNPFKRLFRHNYIIYLHYLTFGTFKAQPLHSISKKFKILGGKSLIIILSRLIFAAVWTGYFQLHLYYAQLIVYLHTRIWNTQSIILNSSDVWPFDRLIGNSNIYWMDTRNAPYGINLFKWCSR